MTTKIETYYEDCMMCRSLGEYGDGGECPFCNGRGYKEYSPDHKDFQGVPVPLHGTVVVSGGKSQYQGFRVFKVTKFTPKGFMCAPLHPRVRHDGTVDKYDSVPKFYTFKAVARITVND